MNPRVTKSSSSEHSIAITNSEITNLPQRACKDARVASSIAPAFESRGDPKKAVKVKASIQKQASQPDDTLYRIYINTTKSFLQKGDSA